MTGEINPDADIVITDDGIKIKGEFVITSDKEKGGMVIHTKDTMTQATLGKDMCITSGALDTKRI